MRREPGSSPEGQRTEPCGRATRRRRVRRADHPGIPAASWRPGCRAERLISCEALQSSGSLAISWRNHSPRLHGGWLSRSLSSRAASFLFGPRLCFGRPCLGRKRTGSHHFGSQAGSHHSAPTGIDGLRVGAGGRTGSRPADRPGHGRSGRRLADFGRGLRADQPRCRRRDRRR